MSLDGHVWVGHLVFSALWVLVSCSCQAPLSSDRQGSASLPSDQPGPVLVHGSGASAPGGDSAGTSSWDQAYVADGDDGRDMGAEDLPEGMPPIYQPPDGKTLVFIGQDNASVGANGGYREGYVDHPELGPPAGVTSYLGFAFPCESPLPGLEVLGDWGAGPVHLTSYLNSEALQDGLVHLSIDMAYDNTELLVARGEKDECVRQLAATLRAYPETLFLLRIGYEFDGAHNSYEPVAYRQAFRRVVELLLAEGVRNFNTVMSAVVMTSSESAWERYWPGDGYVHWVGYSYFAGSIPTHPATISFAQRKGKPVFIAESTPRGKRLGDLGESPSETLWQSWYAPLLAHIKAHSVIKAWSYINANWDAQAMWQDQGWGDSRVQINATIRARWRQMLSEAHLVHEPAGAAAMLGYSEP